MGKYTDSDLRNKHFLFKSTRPERLEFPASVVAACSWMIAVMDEDDRQRKFVASVMVYFMDRGSITDKQMEALKSILAKTMRQFDDEDLESLGSKKSADIVIDVADVVHPVLEVGQ